MVFSTFQLTNPPSMEHTFILGTNGNMKNRADQAAHYLIGLLGLSVGSLMLLSDNLSSLKLIGAIIMVSASLIHLLYVLLAFANNSRFAPKVIVRSDEIEIKPTIYSNATIIQFDRIEVLSVRKRILKVTLKNSGKTMKYRTTGCYPFEIKEALAHVATRRDLRLK